MLNNTAVHFARPLENVSLDYHAVGLIGDTLLPVVPVVKESDKYLVWDRDSAFTLTDDLVQDGAPSKDIYTTFAYQNYTANMHALRFRITDRMKDNADSEIRLQTKFTRLVQDKLQLNQEKRIVALMNAAGNYAASNQITLAGANQWNSSSFVGSIEAIFDGAKEAIRQQTGGQIATHATIPKPVSLVIKRDAMVREVVKYTHDNLLVDGDLPPKLWNLNIVIPAATYNSANEGAAPSMTDIWGKNVYITYVTPNAGEGILTYGYIFRQNGVQVRTWRQEDIRSQIYEVAYMQDERIVSPYAGYLITGAIA